jgi:hypothetical protein
MHYLIPRLGKRYQVSYNQVEICTDIQFPDEESCRDLTEAFIMKYRKILGQRVDTLLRKNFRITPKDRQKNNFDIQIWFWGDPVLHLTVKSLQFKITVKVS